MFDNTTSFDIYIVYIHMYIYIYMYKDLLGPTGCYFAHGHGSICVPRSRDQDAQQACREGHRGVVARIPPGTPILPMLLIYSK